MRYELRDRKIINEIISVSLLKNTPKTSKHFDDTSIKTGEIECYEEIYLLWFHIEALSHDICRIFAEEFTVLKREELRQVNGGT